MTLWENVLAHYGWQGAALAAVLVVLLCVQLWYYLFAYGRIPGYKNSRRRQVLDAEPPLSVIVPMFSEDTLFVEERLPLMLAQEYSDFEVVIVYVGRDNDFFEDLLRIRQSFPRVTATKIEQDARFPISTKMALNVGIKSAHYEHLIVTSTDVRPLSDRWLALMAKGFLRGDVVVGYCGLERRRGLADRWMRTDRMMETLRDGVYYLTSDSAAQQMMSSSKPLTQIQILQLEQNFSRAFSLGDSLNPDVVSAIYLIKNDQYVPVYGGNYYLNTSWRVRQMYQTHEDCNSARTLYTHYAIIGYAYMIVDFVDLNTMQPLGKIIVELNIDKLLSTLSLNQLYPSTVVIFSGAQGKRIGSLQTDLFRENEDMNKWYHASSSLRKSRERVDIYIPNAEILAGVRQSTRVYFLVCAAILILALLLAIFALQDSFGTACNVTGDGALAMMMEGIFNRNRQLDDRFGTGE